MRVNQYWVLLHLQVDVEDKLVQGIWSRLPMKMYSQRLCLEPLEPYHAKLLFDELQSASIYKFIEDVPPQSVQSLRDRYMVMARRQSPDGTEIWLNWAVWSLVEKCYVGYVQATITVDNSAMLGYVFFPNFWGKGYALEALTKLGFHSALSTQHGLNAPLPLTALCYRYCLPGLIFF